MRANFTDRLLWFGAGLEGEVAALDCGWLRVREGRASLSGRRS